MKRFGRWLLANGAVLFFLVVGALVTGGGSDDHDMVVVAAGGVLLGTGIALKALQIWREALDKRGS